MAAFYNQGDQNIYKDFQYVPQEKYRLGFTAPVQGGGQDASTPSFGIPNTNAFTNSGDDNNFSGSTSNLGGQFQRAVDARQARLNKPIDTSTFIGKAKDFMNPQSANQIMTEGYQEPRFQPGIIGTMLGKIDRYRNLPQLDQVFIAQNMGYTGPTVFGDNKGNQDPFGINTRSGFGNYGEFVDKKAGQLTDTLTKQGGKIFDKYAVDPITGQVLDEEEFSYDPITGQYIGTNAAAIAKANKMNKMNLTKLGFYTNKKQERQDLQNQIDARNAAEAAAAAAGGNRAAQARQKARDDATVAQAYAGNDGYSDGSSGQQKGGGYNDPFDPGGGEKDGGFIDGSNRRPFAHGGLASIL